MIQEISAGAVIIRKNNGRWEILCLTDKKGSLTFPKGLIENRETRRETAIREAYEETGISGIQFIQELHPISYIYTRTVPIKKTVYYILFRSDSRKKLHPQKEEGIQNVRWVPLATAPDVIGYPKTNKSILQEVNVNTKTLK